MVKGSMDTGYHNLPLVLIEWEDSAQPIPSWGFLSDLEVGGPVRCVSVGWLVHDDDEVKAVAANVGEIDRADSVQVSGVIRIPARAVLKLTRLGQLRAATSSDPAL